MKSEPNSSRTLPVKPFECQQDWADWLSNNHSTASGIWLQLAKKGSGMPSVSYEEAVEAALCYGWIDGQKKSHNEHFWLQRFTPRTAKSIWSKINKEKAIVLMKAGKMQPAGIKQVENAKQDGRWNAAYDSARQVAVPSDLQSALDGNPKAKAFFEALDSRNRYAILFRIQNVKKAETRSKKIAQFVDMLARHEKIY